MNRVVNPVANQVANQVVVGRVAVVLHADRHADPEVHVFYDATAAIEFAKARAREFDRFNDLCEGLTPSMIASGWLYFAQYGEGNSIRVEAMAVR